MLPLYIFSLLLIAFPTSISAACNPNFCPIRCCPADGSDTCPAFISECDVCIPSRCLSGCCNGSVCDPTGSSCNDFHSLGTIIIIIVIVTVVLITLLTSSYFLRKHYRESQRNAIIFANIQGRQGQNLEAGRQTSAVIVPIMEIEAPKVDANIGLEVNKMNSHSVHAVEVDHGEFLQRIELSNKELYKNGQLMQEQLLSQGVKPGPEDNIPNVNETNGNNGN